MQILPILIFLANDFLHIHRYELIQLPSGTSLYSWQSTSQSMAGFHFFNIAMHMYQPRWKPHHDMPLSVHTFQDTEYCHTVFVKCISRSLERNAWSWKESYMLQRDSGSFLNYLNFDNFWIPPPSPPPCVSGDFTGLSYFHIVEKIAYNCHPPKWWFICHFVYVRLLIWISSGKEYHSFLP